VAVGSASLSVLLGVLWHPREDRATLRLDRLHHRAVQGFVSLDRSEHCVLILVAATGVLAAGLPLQSAGRQRPDAKAAPRHDGSLGRILRSY
jgi:hypothetical protein